MIAQIVDAHTIVVSDLSQFDPIAIVHSGQVFRYFVTEQGITIISGAHTAEIKTMSDKIVITCDDATYFYQYFDLDTDYQAIKKTLTSPRLQNALKLGGGIRILRADFVEMVISFIISANNNIKRFTKTLNDLCAKVGTKMANGFYAFPNLAQLATLSVADFRALGCGYRDQYLVKVITQLQDLDVQQLVSLPTTTLYQTLLKLSGVGPKVASCILLFAFHRLEVAPVDTWIKKAIAQLTVDEQKNILHGKYAGVAQQYIFYYLQYLRLAEL